MSQSSQQPQLKGSVIIYILMRKLRLREVKWLTQSHTASEGQSWDSTWGQPDSEEYFVN